MKNNPITLSLSVFIGLLGGLFLVLFYLTNIGLVLLKWIGKKWTHSLRINTLYALNQENLRLH